MVFIYDRIYLAASLSTRQRAVGVEHFQADGVGEFGLSSVGGEEFFDAKEPRCGDV